MLAVHRTDRWVGTVDVPEPSGDGVLVHVRSAGICGSDLHKMGTRPFGMAIGHEFAGVLDDGTPVAVQPAVACGTCRPCRAGRDHLCDAVTAFYGVECDGGMAERVRVDPTALVRLPPEADPGVGALVEPLAVVVHGLHRLDDLGGQRVLVVGGGSIGLLAAAAAIDAEADVDLVARHPAQSAAGRALGARLQVRPEYDVVIDAAGTQSALDQAVQVVRRGGVILELAMFWDPVTLSPELLRREITLVPSMLFGHHHGEREFDAAAALLARTPALGECVITHRFPLARAADAFRVASDRRAGAIKVHLVT